MTYIYLEKLNQKPLSIGDILVIKSLDCPHFFSLRPRSGEFWNFTDLNGFLAGGEVLNMDKKNKISKSEISVLIKNINYQKKAENTENTESKEFKEGAGEIFIAILDKPYLDKLFEIIPLTHFNKITLFSSQHSQIPTQSLNLSRYKNILIRSCEQCHNLQLPSIQIIPSFPGLLDILPKNAAFLDSTAFDNITNITTNQNSYSSYNLPFIIGPEGGFSKNENELIDNFIKMNEKSMKIYLGEKVFPAWFMPAVLTNFLK